MRIMFGGSFNPPTVAHQQIITHLSQIPQSEVIIVPNGDIYGIKELVAYSHRKAMIELLIAGITNVTICDIEQNRSFQGIVATLRQLNHPVLAIGSDCLLQLHSWKNAKELLAENHFIIYCRNHTKEQVENLIQTSVFLNQYAQHFQILSVFIPDVSATTFRMTRNAAIVPTSVYQYIIKNHLYEV